MNAYPDAKMIFIATKGRHPEISECRSMEEAIGYCRDLVSNYWSRKMYKSEIRKDRIFDIFLVGYSALYWYRYVAINANVPKQMGRCDYNGQKYVYIMYCEDTGGYVIGNNEVAAFDKIRSQATDGYTTAIKISTSYKHTIDTAFFTDRSTRDSIISEIEAFDKSDHIKYYDFLMTHFLSETYFINSNGTRVSGWTSRDAETDYRRTLNDFVDQTTYENVLKCGRYWFFEEDCDETYPTSNIYEISTDERS